VNAKAISDVAIDAERRVRSGEDVTLPLICTYGTERLWFETTHHLRKTGTNGTRRKPSRVDGYRDCLNSTIQETALIDWIRDETTASCICKEIPSRSVPSKVQLQRVSKAPRHSIMTADIKTSCLARSTRASALKNLSDGQRIILTLVGD